MTHSIQKQLGNSETCKEKDSPALPSSSLSINFPHPPLETWLQTQTSPRSKLTSHLSKIASNLYDPVHKPLTPFEPPLTLSSSAELLCVCVPSITPSHILDLLIHLFVKKQFKHTNSLFTLLSGSTPKKMPSNINSPAILNSRNSVLVVNCLLISDFSESSLPA